MHREKGWKHRLSGMIALAILLAIYGWAAWTADKCHRNHGCDGDYPPKYEATSIAVPESADDRIADYTWWLSVATAALVFVSLFQGYFLIRADKNAKDAADAALSAANTASRHVEETAKLAQAMSRAAAAMEESVNIARSDFIATHRPRLRIRWILMDPMADDKPISARFMISNIGDTVATWSSISAMISADPNLGNDAPTDTMFEDSKRPAKQEIAAGAYMLIEMRASVMTFSPGPPNTLAWFQIRGKFTYHDQRGVERITAFDREFRLVSGSIFGVAGIPVSGTENEYED